MDKQKLIELLNSGKSHKECADILGASRPAVSYAAKKLGLRPNRKVIDIQHLRQSIEGGLSFSEYSEKYGFSLGAVSNCAKKNNIISSAITKSPHIPDDIVSEYNSGISIYKLSKKYGVSVHTIKRRLKKCDINIRSMDEAKRPALLNCYDDLLTVSRTKSCRTIASELGCKIKTVTDAMRRLGIDFPFIDKWDKLELSRLYELYMENKLTPSQIASILGYPYQVILRQLKNAGFPIESPGGKSSPSKYKELNDAEWLRSRYEISSANDIAIEVGCPIGNVFHYLRKYGIKTRTKEEYLKLLVDNAHGSKLEFRGFNVNAQEKRFLNTLAPDSDIKRNIKLEHGGSMCFIDFEVNGKLFEVKPPEIIKVDGPDRNRAVKQLMLCKKNNVDVVFWTRSGEWNQELTDRDIYYASNWKLFFDSCEECYDWLSAYGFEPLKYSIRARRGIIDSIDKMDYCKNGYELNANYPNISVSKLTSHFFPHYWMSTHKNYLPISAAWEVGNKSVLRQAVYRLWEAEKEVNIYGLVKYIKKFFKDFATVSVFKPWIAGHIYDKFLPNGGKVIDPSCGWGGRFMAAVNRNIEYIGYDINQLSIESHEMFRKFLGSRVVIEPKFIRADSSVVDFEDGDLLFTSPPYDDTELYYGVDSIKTATLPIYENIFSKFKGTIVLNVPRRHEEQCIAVARKFGRELSDRFEMKTASFMGREKTYEPILVF